MNTYFMVNEGPNCKFLVKLSNNLEREYIVTLDS